MEYITGHTESLPAIKGSFPWTVAIVFIFVGVAIGAGLKYWEERRRQQSAVAEVQP